MALKFCSSLSFYFLITMNKTPRGTEALWSLVFNYEFSFMALRVLFWATGYQNLVISIQCISKPLLPEQLNPA
jgi:hypothetical protein